MAVVQDWIFSVRVWAEGSYGMKRAAVVGPARASTVETALHLAHVPEDVRAEIRADETVRKFVEGSLDPEANGYHAPSPCPSTTAWVVCIGSVQEVIR
jgi:hypothetical protein